MNKLPDTIRMMRRQLMTTYIVTFSLILHLVLLLLLLLLLLMMVVVVVVVVYEYSFVASCGIWVIVWLICAILLLLLLLWLLLLIVVVDCCCCCCCGWCLVMILFRQINYDFFTIEWYRLVLCENFLWKKNMKINYNFVYNFPFEYCSSKYPSPGIVMWLVF